MSELSSWWTANKFRREGHEIAKVLVAEELLDSNYKDGGVHQTDEATTQQESIQQSPPLFLGCGAQGVSARVAHTR